MHKIHSIETLCSYPNRLHSPIQTLDGVYMVSENGDVLKYSEGALTGEFIIIGQPSSVTHNPVDDEFFICDFAHQSIVSRKGKTSGQQLSNQICDYEGQSLLGPHTAIYAQSDEIYFTDSGPFCESSIENPTGSVFMYLPSERKMVALAHRSLAYPSGLALSNDLKKLFVCQMAKNRLLRFMLDSEQPSYSTFYQFNGRFGPSTIAIKNELLFVANFEFKELANKGLISVINMEGELVESIVLPGSEITGISFSQNFGRSMYVTDNSAKPSLLKITFKGDKSDDREESKDQ